MAQLNSKRGAQNGCLNAAQNCDFGTLLPAADVPPSLVKFRCRVEAWICCTLYNVLRFLVTFRNYQAQSKWLSLVAHFQVCQPLTERRELVATEPNLVEMY